MRFTAISAAVLVFALIFIINSPKANAQEGNDSSELTSTDVLTLLDENSLAEELAEDGDKKKPVKKVVKYKVSEGDTLAEIAKFYKTDWKRIFNKNENIKDPDILNPGITIIIPKDSEKLPDRVSSLQVSEPQGLNETPNRQASKPSVKAYRGGNSAGNGYAYGYCTWYVKQKRPDFPNQMGNAINWVASAQAMGLPTGSKPRAGAIGQKGNHVVYVEKVNGDGTITVSDMNYAGWAVVTTRKVPANSHHYIY